MSDPLVESLAKLLGDPLSGLTPRRLARMTLRQLKAIYGQKRDQGAIGNQPTMAFDREPAGGFQWDIPADPSEGAEVTVGGKPIDAEPLMWNLVRAGMLKEESVRRVIAEKEAYLARKRAEGGDGRERADNSA